VTTALLLHGLGGSSFDWPVTASSVSMDCVLHNMPFHGGRPLDRPVRFDELVEDVLTVRDRRDDEVVYGGISLGAAVAMQCVTRRPQRTRGLLLVSPMWGRDEAFRGSIDRVSKLGRIIHRHGIHFAWDVVRALPPVCDWDEGDRHIYRDRFLAFDAQATSAALVQLPKERPILDVATIVALRVPVGIVGWTDDKIHPLECAETLADQIRANFLWTRPQPMTRVALGGILAQALEEVARCRS